MVSENTVNARLLRKLPLPGSSICFERIPVDGDASLSSSVTQTLLKPSDNLFEAQFVADCP